MAENKTEKTDKSDQAAKSARPKPATKSVTYQKLAEATGLTRKQVATFFDELSKLIKQDLGKKGPGIFNLPGLLKIKRVEKAATKARPGKDPRTGAPITIKAKPKRTIVKAVALKALKDMVK
jgi:nucleoid DNA-binding protein